MILSILSKAGNKTAVQSKPATGVKYFFEIAQAVVDDVAVAVPGMEKDVAVFSFKKSHLSGGDTEDLFSAIDQEALLKGLGGTLLNTFQESRKINRQSSRLQVCGICREPVTDQPGRSGFSR